MADEALLERSVATLRAALRRRFDATFDFDVRDATARPDGSVEPAHVVVSLHPPRREPGDDIDDYAVL